MPHPEEKNEAMITNFVTFSLTPDLQVDPEFQGELERLVRPTKDHRTIILLHTYKGKGGIVVASEDIGEVNNAHEAVLRALGSREVDNFIQKHASAQLQLITGGALWFYPPEYQKETIKIVSSLRRR